MVLQKYRDTYRIVTKVSQYVSHHDLRYRTTPTITAKAGHYYSNYYNNEDNNVLLHIMYGRLVVPYTSYVQALVFITLPLLSSR